MVLYNTKNELRHAILGIIVLLVYLLAMIAIIIFTSINNFWLILLLIILVGFVNDIKFTWGDMEAPIHDLILFKFIIFPLMRLFFPNVVKVKSLKAQIKMLEIQINFLIAKQCDICGNGMEHMSEDHIRKHSEYLFSDAIFTEQKFCKVCDRPLTEVYKIKN